MCEALFYIQVGSLWVSAGCMSPASVYEEGVMQDPVRFDIFDVADPNVSIVALGVRVASLEGRLRPGGQAAGRRRAGWDGAHRRVGLTHGL